MRNTELCAGITLASPRLVPESSKRSLRHDPVVLWRMQRPNGMQSHSVISPRSDGALVVWFLNDRPLGYREFVDWTSALRWSDQLKAQNWAVGWRAAFD